MPHAAHAPSTEYRPRRPEEMLLHRVVRDHMTTFVAREAERGGSLPRFVDRELRKFVACGSPALGFVRVRCTECGHDRAVPFSCKGRGYVERRNMRSGEASSRALLKHFGAMPSLRVKLDFA